VLTEKVGALRAALAAEAGQGGGNVGDAVTTSVKEEFRHFSREQDARIQSLQREASKALDEVNSLQRRLGELGGGNTAGVGTLAQIVIGFVSIMLGALLFLRIGK
jgi:hypothetical protein